MPLAAQLVPLRGGACGRRKYDSAFSLTTWQDSQTFPRTASASTVPAGWLYGPLAWHAQPFLPSVEVDPCVIQAIEIFTILLGGRALCTAGSWALASLLWIGRMHLEQAILETVIFVPGFQLLSTSLSVLKMSATGSLHSDLHGHQHGSS